MSESQPCLVDNLSEINKKERKTCMERNNTRSECTYIGFKINRLNCKCGKYNNKSYKSINQLIEKFPNTYQFFS